MSADLFFFDLDLQTLKTELKKLGFPAFRATQLWQAFYVDLVDHVDQVTTLPKDLRLHLSEQILFNRLLPINQSISSDQETIKTLFSLSDGNAIETVLMHYNERQTLCISTQAGCAMGCTFCATGQMGFKRNLTSGEIIEQVIQFARNLKKEQKTVTNIVLMGMGEPFQNYKETLAAIDRLNDPGGFNLGARRFTISTVGLVPEILRFAAEKRQINLAVSLHAANDTLRSTMLPVAKKYPLYELMQACRSYVEITHRRITFEWALIDGINDTDHDANELAALLKGLLCHVNIILLNPTTQFAGKAASQDRALSFKKILESKGIPSTIRLRRGIDIHAGCGQLASRHQNH